MSVRGIQGLQNLINKTKINDNDNDVTLGEAQAFIKGAFDSNGDGVINDQDKFDTNGNGVIDVGDDPAKIQMLREMAYSDLGTVVDPVQKAQLQQAQAALRLALQNVSPVVPPPHIDETNPLFNDDQIRNPYDLPDDLEDKRWSDFRKGFEGQTIEIDRGNAKKFVTDILDPLKASNPGLSVDDQAKALVKGLWENEDSVGGEKRKVFRVEELKGVSDYIKSLPEAEREGFKKAFFKEMANYISDPNNGLDQQFVMDSLLGLIQSTDFSGDAENQELGQFVKDLAVGISENSDFFKNKGPASGNTDVVIGNYDGTNDGGVYGSLALIRYNDGTFGFIEHQVASPVNKTRYKFTGGASTPPGGGFGPALPPLGRGPTDPVIPIPPGVGPTDPLIPIPPDVGPTDPLIPIPPPVPLTVPTLPGGGVVVEAEPRELTDAMLNRLRTRGGTLQYFGYDPTRPDTEMKAWEKYAYAIAAKTGDLLESEIPGVKNSTNPEDGKHNLTLDPDYFIKLESKILELSRTTGKSPEQILRETGITNPEEAWAVISSGVFRVRTSSSTPPSSSPTSPIPPAFATCLIEPTPLATI